VLDLLDRQLIRALQIDPRAPFSRIADVLGVSEQTVARRYRRLRADGYLRVLGLVSPRAAGATEWLVRIGCRPGGARRLADALARREDVSWVTLSSGGTEIVCLVRSLSQQQSDELLLQRLPATSQVLSLATHAVLHRFAGQHSDWSGYGDQLTAAQVSQLVGPASAGAAGPGEPARPGEPPGPGEPARPGEPPGPGEPARPGEPAGPGERGSARAAGPGVLQPSDGLLLAALALDGRMSYAALAQQAGWTEGRVIRRVETLRDTGILYFDVDLAIGLMGFAATAYLWLIVEPARLAAIGDEISRHAEVPFAAAITGSANLITSVVCRDSEALYEYVTTRISAAAGVRQLEISPVLSRVKQAGSLMDGLHLATPGTAPRGARPLP
jgi:DNA-binding Lrp family transcriptional regulator